MRTGFKHDSKLVTRRTFGNTCICYNDIISVHDTAVDFEAIKQIKYRYLRALDTKHWDNFTHTLTGRRFWRLWLLLQRGTALHQPYLLGGLHALNDPSGTHRESCDTPENHRKPAIPHKQRGILPGQVIVAESNFMLISSAFYHYQYRYTDSSFLK